MNQKSAVLEPRTGHFRGLGFETKAKDLKMCIRGLHLCLLPQGVLIFLLNRFRAVSF